MVSMSIKILYFSMFRNHVTLSAISGNPLIAGIGITGYMAYILYIAVCTCTCTCMHHVHDAWYHMALQWTPGKELFVVFQGALGSINTNDNGNGNDNRTGHHLLQL